MKDNRGFTLIELIIVMVIMGIVAIGSMVGYNMLNTGSAQRTVERISSMLDYVQLENMTKSKPFYLVIKINSEGDYIICVDTFDVSNVRKTIMSEKLELKKGGEITFQNTGVATEYLISEVPVAGRNISDKLEVCFSNDTGGFIPIPPATEIVSKIGVSASGRSYSIWLVKVTGKHYIE